MEKIKQWAILVSAVSIVSGVLISLLPKGKLKAAYKSFVGVIMVYALLSPIFGTKGLDFSVDEYLSNNYEVSENIDNYALSSMISSAEKAIVDILKDELSEKNIIADVEAKCVLENDEIKLESIVFYGEFSENHKEVIMSLSEKLGFEKQTISFTGESNEK